MPSSAMSRSTTSRGVRASSSTTTTTMTDLASTGLMSHCVPDEDAGVEMTEMVTPKSPDPRKRRSNPFDTEDEESDLWDEDEGTRV